MDYNEFLANKRFVLESSGFDIDKSKLNPMLYDFQKGKACIFADCGLGKTPMQLSWAHQVHVHTGGKVLILAPLAVADQTKREAEKFGYVAKVVEEQSISRSKEKLQTVSKQNTTAEYQTCGQTETLLLSNQATQFEKQIDIATTLMAMDYKGFGNQSMNGVIEWK